MTSLFDSLVSQARRTLPWAEIDLEQFLRDLALNAEHAPVRLEVQYRPLVASRLWWSLTWTSEEGDLEQHTAEAQTLSLCLWRAAVREQGRRDRRSAPSEEKEGPTTGGDS